MFYSETKFLQVLEGEKNEIISMYDNIKQDERHSNVVMISLKSIKQKDFPSWEMGSKKIDDNYEFLTEMDSSTKLQLKALLSGERQNNAINIINHLFK